MDWICRASTVRPIRGHLLLGAVEHLGGQLLTLPDDLLDGHRTDDRAQVAGEDPAGEHRHLVLVRQEPLRGTDDAFGVVADLEGDHRPDVEGNALLGHALFGDLGLAHGQCQKSALAEERDDEGAVTRSPRGRGRCPCFGRRRSASPRPDRAPCNRACKTPFVVVYQWISLISPGWSRSFPVRAQFVPGLDHHSPRAPDLYYEHLGALR